VRQAGAVTLIQRFGGALNAHIHFHMLFLDGVYIDSTNKSRARFRWVKAPTSDELTQLCAECLLQVGTGVPQHSVHRTAGVDRPNVNSRMRCCEDAENFVSKPLADMPDTAHIQLDFGKLV